MKGQTELEQIDLIFKLLGVPNDQTWPGIGDMLKQKGLSLAYSKPTNSKLAEAF